MNMDFDKLELLHLLEILTIFNREDSDKLEMLEYRLDNGAENESEEFQGDLKQRYDLLLNKLVNSENLFNKITEYLRK